jgi:hypothetical protein
MRSKGGRNLAAAANQMMSNDRNSLRLDARRRLRNTDRRDGYVVLIEDRSADAADSELYFLITHSVAAARLVDHPA